MILIDKPELKISRCDCLYPFYSSLLHQALYTSIIANIYIYIYVHVHKMIIIVMVCRIYGIDSYENMKEIMKNDVILLK